MEGYPHGTYTGGWPFWPEEKAYKYCRSWPAPLEGNDKASGDFAKHLRCNTRPGLFPRAFPVFAHHSNADLNNFLGQSRSRCCGSCYR